MPNKIIRIMTWNLGSGIYNDKYSKVDKNSNIKSNINGQLELINSNVCDIYLFQEVSKFSVANRFINQFRIIKNNLRNYKSCFISNKHILTIEGKATFTKYDSISNDLFIPYKSNMLRRDLFISNKHNIITRIKLNNKELIVYNVHLAAYKVQKDLREKQFRYIIDLANNEIENGNYIVIGGDFNMNIIDKPINNLNIAVSDKPTCRDLKEPYTVDSKMNYYDGFIYSNNIKLNNINVINNFKYSDHCPVIAEFEIKER